MLPLGDEPLEVVFGLRDRIRARNADGVKALLLCDFAKRRRDVERL
jgi:hypothetical protein